MKNAMLFFVFAFLFSSCATRAPLAGLEAAVRAELSRSPGVFAVAFRDLSNPRRQLLINDTVSFHAASTMKTPVMVEVYRQAAEGKLKLQDSVLVKNSFASIVDGSPYEMEVSVDSENTLYQKLGKKASLYDLVYQMITYSSNLATNIVIEMVDAKKVTQTMREMGAPYIQVRRGVEDTKAFRLGLNNSTTAYDLLVLFEKIGRGKAVSPEASEAMINILLDQQFREVIPALLPKEVKVAHKTGWITKVRHDSGLVMLPDGRRYVLILLSKGWESDEMATEVMSKVSKLVYDYMANKAK